MSRLDGFVPPLVTETLPVAETFRHVVMHLFQRILHRRKHGHADASSPERFYSRVFSGKDETGQHLTSHEHAYYLPTAESDGNRLDHVTVFAAGGFGPDELAALQSVRRLPWWDGEALPVPLVGLGRPEEFRLSPVRSGPRLGVGHAVCRHATPQEAAVAKTRPTVTASAAGRTSRRASWVEESQRWLGRQLPLAGAAAPTYTVLEHVGRSGSWRPWQLGVTVRPL